MPTQPVQPYTLVIIDLQYDFLGPYATKAREVRHTIKLIRRAKRDKMPILVVEYHDSGKTLKPIQKLVKPYRRSRTVVKKANSGGREIKHALRRDNFPRQLRVCGVNTLFCVLDTVRDLPRSYKIEVIEQACNSYEPLVGPSPTDHEAGIKFLQKLRNVTVVT